MRRIFFDLSGLARYRGGQAGIARVERAFFDAAIRAHHDVVPVFFEPTDQRYRLFSAEWQDRILGFSAAIDYPPPTVARRGWRRYLPNRGRPVHWLEERRLRARTALASRTIDAVQQAILSVRKHSYRVRSATGERFSHVPPSLALADPILPSRGDIMFMTAGDWTHCDLENLARLKQTQGVSVATMCHDLIPVDYPDFFPPGVARDFEAFWRRMVAISDLILVSSETVRRDIERFARDRQQPAPKTVLVRLCGEGANVEPGPLPHGLAPGRFALYVSTIEPRKNHRLLLRCAALLDASRREAAEDFLLVFAGRRGWLVDDVIGEIANASAQGLPLRHIDDADDTIIEALYRDCAFCLYPSLYEGFGLPVVEAALRGKAVICSDGGALSEFSDIALVLPSDRPDIWTTTIRAWMEDPSLRKQAGLIPWRTWQDVAGESFGAIRALQG
jgi:glycosyltransferase involved in cell wall biosynthesis